MMNNATVLLILITIMEEWVAKKIQKFSKDVLNNRSKARSSKRALQNSYFDTMGLRFIMWIVKNKLLEVQDYCFEMSKR